MCDSWLAGPSSPPATYFLRLGLQNIIAAVNSITGPVVFEYRASQPSAPGQLPAVDPDKLRLVDPPPKPKPKEEAKKQENNNDKNDNKGGDGGDKGGNGGNGDKGGNNGGDDGGNKNRRLLRASRALQQGGEDAVSCYNEWQFEVASDGQCTGGRATGGSALEQGGNL